MAVTFCLLVLIMHDYAFIHLFVASGYLSGNGLTFQQHSSASGHEQPQRCCATCTTGVPGVSSPVENFLPPTREIYVSGRGLLVATINAPRLFVLTLCNVYHFGALFACTVYIKSPKTYKRKGSIKAPEV